LPSISHLVLERRFMSDTPLFQNPFMLEITIFSPFEIATVEVQSIGYKSKHLHAIFTIKSIQYTV
jgi:hypothetical protein